MMLKWSNFLPTFVAFIGFILSILCLFAGSKSNFLTGSDILTLYTPDIGNNTGIHDFYSIYPMSYCEGFLGPSLERNVTGCFNQTLPFAFDPTKAMLRDSQPGTLLYNLGWPSPITGDFKAFTLTTQTMSVLYCIGTAVAGAAILAKFGFAISQAPHQMAVESSLLLLSFTSLGIASIIATVMSFEFVSLINYHGEVSRVSAKYGQRFLGMTWAAVVFLLVSSMLSGFFAMVERGGSGPKFSLDEPKEPAEGQE